MDIGGRARTESGALAGWPRAARYDGGGCAAEVPVGYIVVDPGWKGWSGWVEFVFFFLKIPPPPRSTLFPYATLFRSVYSGTRAASFERRCSAAWFLIAKSFSRS